MAEHTPASHSTVGLSTQLEEDFVSPLTAVRGALEILRDFPDLGAAQRARFVEAALAECARLEKGVAALGTTVYAAGSRSVAADDPAPPAASGHASRFHLVDDHEAIEVDLSGMEFSSARVVNEFYDQLERFIEATGRSWYLLVNYRDCSIWPEAWVAFAHRAKKVAVNYSLGTARFEEAGGDPDRPEQGSTAGGRATDTFPSRDEAIAHLDALRRSSSAHGRH